MLDNLTTSLILLFIAHQSFHSYVIDPFLSTFWYGSCILVCLFKFVCLSMYLINATHIHLFVLYLSYFVVDTSYSLKNKKSNNAGDGTYRCEACNFETKYSQNLQAHFKTLKHLGNTRMSCEESAIFFT